MSYGRSRAIWSEGSASINLKYSDWGVLGGRVSRDDAIAIFYIIVLWCDKRDEAIGMHIGASAMRVNLLFGL